MARKPTYIEELIRLFTASQAELIRLLQKTPARGTVTQYRKELLRQVNKEIALLQSRATPLMESLIRQAYVQGIITVNRKLGIKMSSKEETVILKELSKAHRKTINVFIQNKLGDLSDTQFFIGRQIKDSIQKATEDAIGLKLTTNETLKECKKNILRNFAENGINAIKTKNNRTIRLDAYADLVARSTVREVTNTATIKQVEELGYDLVKISSHTGACPICQKYEGRVYSISGKDKRFPRLDVVFSSGYANIHPRCRHVLEPYIETFNDVGKDIIKSNMPFQEPDKNDKQVQAYYSNQREKARMRQDRLQWEKYKTVLPNDVPSTLSGFRRMKVANSENYKELKKKYKEKTQRES
ncbi:hypothetical protein TSYNTROOL_14180 [Tepidanaerobacter syntrophicus]|uniref:phage minor capsid protein n=1 Tax=Tepidanaerobacter syntrophicus TaxID=224999 RepID=UPI0022EFD0B0|nr:phage minor capsid protein [Tepidanaerobacter syntrophicus]GLI51332.1 hypothetical protein TSYNTROOL_14180 [Tepidanaerobacter syntrophicus]